MKLYRQGDLAFTEDQIPNEAKRTFKGKEHIVAYGEATGHCHTLIAKPETTIEKYENEDSIWYKILGGTATITHHEHKPFVMEPGIYKFNFEREYDYCLEETKKVID